MGNSIYLGGGIKSAFCGGNVKEIWQGSNKIFGGGGKIDDDIVVLFDGVSNYGFQPNKGTTSPTIHYDVNGPLDVSGTGWSGTPYVKNEEISNYIAWSQTDIVNLLKKEVPLTLECWAIQKSKDTDNYTPISIFLSVGNYWTNGFSFYDKTGKINFWVNDSRQAVTSETYNVWHHFALTRYITEGITNKFHYLFFCDGILCGSLTVSKVSVDSPILCIPSNSYSSIRNKIYVSQLVLRNSCKWTENFTPPTKPYILGV